MTRRKYRRQEPPFNVTLELTLGCSLSCSFCAVSAIQEKPGKNYKFMEKATLVSALSQVKDLGWNCRVGFAMRGEPTQHPDYIGMVAAARDILPKAHITMLTNAGGLLRKPGARDNVLGLFEAGLNVLGLDDYQNVGWVPKVCTDLGVDNLPSGDTHTSGFQFFRYPEDLRGNPHKRRPRNSRTLVRIRDISLESAGKKKGNHGKLFNYAGLGAPLDDSMAGKRCHHPFRQMVVHWNGNVPGCCNEWQNDYICGNVLKEGVDATWQGDALGAMREKLIRGERDFKPCLGCNHRSYRVGLLPDLMGKGKLHKPDAQTEADIHETQERSKAHALPRFLREWEKTA